MINHLLCYVNNRGNESEILGLDAAVKVFCKIVRDTVRKLLVGVTDRLLM